MSRPSTARRRTALVVASLAVHAAAIAVMSRAPVDTRVRVQPVESWAPIEIVVWDPPAPSPPPAPTDEAPSPDATPPPEAAADAGPTRSPGRRSTPPDAPAANPAVEPAPPSAEPAPPTAEPAPPSAPALALHGLREAKVAGAVVVPSPRLDAGGVRKLGPGGATEPAVLGPTPRPSAGDGHGGADTAPRSLADAGFARDRKGNLVYREPAGHFTAKLLPDGRVHFKDHLIKPSPVGVTMPDLYAVVSKVQKHELWARDKTKLLERTFELRLAIAVAFAERQIDYRIKVLYRELLEVWGTSERPALARRKTLFERWDDCDERMRVTIPGFEDTKIDAVRLDAAKRARTTIVEFVRKHLPAHSAEAYGADELAALNRGRKSEQRFAPYDDGA